MSRFTIDHHPNKQLIIRDIASGMYSDESIAKRYGLRDRQSVERYRKKVLPEIMKLSAYRDTDGLLAAITQNIVRVDKMLEGLEKWAVDPEDRNVFAMDPRADEVYVIYTKLVEVTPGKVTRVRVKENLQDVIDSHFSEFERTGMRLVTRKADQRIVLLKAMEVMGKNLQLLITARDSLSQKDGDDSYRAGLEELLRIIQSALTPYPEALEALIKAISSAEGQTANGEGHPAIQTLDSLDEETL